MAHASSVVSARAMAPGTITPHKNTSQLDDYCAALVADYCSAVDTSSLRSGRFRPNA